MKDELWMRKEKLNVFVLTNDDYLQIRATPTRRCHRVEFVFWIVSLDCGVSQTMNVTSKSHAFYWRTRKAICLLTQIRSEVTPCKSERAVLLVQLLVFLLYYSKKKLYSTFWYGGRDIPDSQSNVLRTTFYKISVRVF